MDDAELLHAWRAGDAAAGQRLVKRHFGPVYGFFRNKVRTGVEDLVQRTFLHCVESRDAFRGEASFRAYVFGIARNVLYAHYRDRKIDVDTASTSMALEDEGAGPRTILDKRREHRLLVRALRQQPLDDQIALELFYFEELKGRELAVVLGVPEGTVRTRLRKARSQLEATIAELDRAGEGARATTENIDQWVVSLRDVIRSEGLRD